MGWMPTAVDLSSWNSLWTIEKIKLSGYHPKLKETLFDFNFGYITSAFLSICFVTLGAFLIYGTDTEIAKQGHLFAHQVIQLYTQVFGSWSYIIISSCTFSIMFGTCIAVFDGYGRATKRIIELFGERNKTKTSNKSYPMAVITLIIGSFILIEIFSFRGDFSILVNLATIISFLVAPVIAIFNHYLVTKKIDDDFKPSPWLKNPFLYGYILSNWFFCILFDLYIYNMKNFSLTVKMFVLSFQNSFLTAQTLTKSYTTQHRTVNINQFEDNWMVQVQHLELTKPGGNGYHDFLQQQKEINQIHYKRQKVTH